MRGPRGTALFAAAGAAGRGRARVMWSDLCGKGMTGTVFMPTEDRRSPSTRIYRSRRSLTTESDPVSAADVGLAHCFARLVASPGTSGFTTVSFAAREEPWLSVTICLIIRTLLFTQDGQSLSSLISLTSTLPVLKNLPIRGEVARILRSGKRSKGREKPGSTRRRWYSPAISSFAL